MTDGAIVLLGSPGSGKGTLGALLARRFSVPLVSAGDLLRGAAESDLPAAPEIGESIEAGTLVDDDVTNKIVRARIRRADCCEGFILDGYPRTVVQARYLSEFLSSYSFPEAIVLHLDILPEAATARLLSRLECVVCGRSYNVKTRPPAYHGRCDDDGMPLVRRREDNPVSIRHRIQTYAQTAIPILEHYQALNYHWLNAEQDPEDLLMEAESILCPAAEYFTGRLGASARA